MGQQQSQQEQEEEVTLPQVVAYAILTQNMSSLKRLTDSKECEKLLGLTKQVMGKSYSVDELDKYVNQHQLQQGQQEGTKGEQDSCHVLSKFLVKLAHLYAAIMTTVNPIFRYKDEQGKMVETQWFDKHKLSNQASKRLYHMNICSGRINRLKRWQNHGFVPDSCDLQIQETKETTEETTKETKETTEETTKETKENKETEQQTTKPNMEDKPGMIELIELYYDSDYDVETGQFMAMSPAAQQAYQEDLQSFYHVFANIGANIGVHGLPPHIKRFSDIQIQDIDQNMCVSTKHNETTTETRSNETTTKETSNERKEKKRLLTMYAANLREMIRTNHENQTQLLHIVNQLFTYTDPSTLFGQKQMTIHPSLTEAKLDQLIQEAREVIVRMYLSCEINYLQGLKLYEAIVEHIILDTSKQQLTHMRDLADQWTTTG